MIALFFTPAAWASQYGPAEPDARPGSFSLGLGFFHFKYKLKPENGGGTIFRFHEETTRADQYFLQATYAPRRELEIYLRFGVSDIRAADSLVVGNERPDFNEDFRGFGAVGLKTHFVLTDHFAAGPFIQASIYSRYQEEILATRPTPSGPVMVYATQNIRNLRDLHVGLTFQARIPRTRILVYLGPVASWARADYEIRGTAGSSFEKLEVTFKESQNIGGFAGLKFPLFQGFNFELEGQYRNGSEFSWGAMLIYSF